MDIGTILLIIVCAFLLLVIFFLPLIKRSSKQDNPYTDKEREEAYRRGLIIGSLLEVEREIHLDEQQHRE